MSGADRETSDRGPRRSGPPEGAPSGTTIARDTSAPAEGGKLDAAAGRRPGGEVSGEAPPWRTLLAVGALSAAILAYELVLMRLFSITGWSSFAAMVISIALLGFGASGTALALLQHRLLPRFEAAFAASAALFALTATLGFAAALRVPFNPLAIVWEPRQLAWLALDYALLVPPFLFGGAALGLAFSRHSAAIGRVYGFDLVGAGVGALGAVALMFALPPTGVLRVVAALGLVAAALPLLRAHRVAAAAAALAALLVALWLPPGLTALQPHVSEYKGLALALRVPDARIVQQRSSPMGLVTVVESPTIPFRHAPGLSLANVQEPPEQLGVFTDADGLSVITRLEGDPAALEYLDQTTAAAPYHMLEDPEVLILGAGGGEPVLLALHHGAPEIDAVELNPDVARLVAEDHAEFAGHLADRPGVALHVDEARSFVERALSEGERYDLVQIPLRSSYGAAAGGAQGLQGDHALTVEAIRDDLRALEPGGLLSATLWVKLPPRDTLKLFATAVEALESSGAADPGDHLALIRGWSTATLVVGRDPLSAAQVAGLKDFAEARSFDVAYYPGMAPEEANRFNVLDRPYFFEAAAALAGPEREAFIRAYKFAIAPATDDRPFFSDFFKWRALPELLSLRAQGGAAMLDMGRLVAWATLAQAVALSVLLILAPLALRRRRFAPGARRGWVAPYFLALGLAFLLVEIAYIERFTLFLGHPLHAVAVVLAGFLAFAGAGSVLAPRLERALGGHAVGAAALGIAAVALGYLLVLPPLFGALITWPDAAKVAVSLALIAPLAALMGMPFPLGIAAAARESGDLVPWAWGINGCASVAAALLASLLATHIGFTGVVAVAVALYLAAPLALPRRAGARRAMSAAGDRRR